MKLEGLAPVKSDSNVSRQSISRGAAKDRVIINVGGYRHETYLSTLRVVPDSRLAWIGENASKQAEYDPETNEYFFDRHPGAFVNVLNYYRTGKLHCPADVCGPLFEEELGFWGIEELQMEPCCWSNYTQHREAQATMKAFEGLQKENEDSENENSTVMVDPNSPRQRIMKQQIWALLEQPYSSKYAQMLAMVSLVIIVLSVATFCIESMPFFEQYTSEFKHLEIVYCTWFTLEFIARFFSCPDKIAFGKSFMTWVDILSVIPLYISLAAKERMEQLNFLFVLRLVRIFRLFRFFRTMSGMQVIGHTLRASARELFLLVLILLIPMVIFSTLVFYAESAAAKDGNTEFTSIPESFWWAVITMTTVGYGDVYPKTAIGKMIGTVCACVGVLIVALPVSVIGNNFTLFYSHAQAQLKLPKKKRKPLLLGVAGALVSESTLHNNDEDSQEEGGDAVKDPMTKPRDSTTEFKHLRNPSIIPRTRSTRRQARGNIDIPDFPFPPMAKIESDVSDCEPQHKKTTRSQTLSAETSSMTNISNGLRGISEVMLQITAPVTRRMAISPNPTPPSKRGSRRKRRSKRSPLGNEESSGYERESFHTTDADSAAENNGHQLALEELKAKMKAQSHNVSDSSNCNPLSSKENITSSEENPRSPLSQHSFDNPSSGHDPIKEHKSASHMSLKGITEDSITDDPGDATKQSEKGLLNMWGRAPNIDTWIKQPRARAKTFACKRLPDCWEEKRESADNLRSDAGIPGRTNNPVDDGSPRISYNGSLNELKVRNAIGLKERRTSSERNMTCGHESFLRDTSISKSLEQFGSSTETCRRRNDELSVPNEFGSDFRIPKLNNTIV